ncbi:hypothetical protein AVEN_231720-1 [Araneus ventricosus]|uniref:Uncharacterized protein n=1 Tax=Araneus ventricosus TaxID=182803 RepID=A0A4Y2RPU8_ARAVE|nr:hypothetical protein AVEN_231720-1 [Araneus ventricosus]
MKPARGCLLTLVLSKGAFPSPRCDKNSRPIVGPGSMSYRKCSEVRIIHRFFTSLKRTILLLLAQKDSRNPPSVHWVLGTHAREESDEKKASRVTNIDAQKISSVLHGVEMADLEDAITRPYNKSLLTDLAQNFYIFA